MTWTFRVPFQANYVVVAEPSSVEYILKTNYDNFVKGPQFSDRFREVLGYGIFQTDGPAHKIQRQVASHLFTRNTLSEFMMEVFNEHAAILCLKLRGIKATESIDMQVLLIFYFNYFKESSGPVYISPCADVIGVF